ncbi:MAG: site-specific DNA-methyltransferase [Alphaproteobacteria bacterium]|nr:MAG: site-specific DNA-methyltransferase [Alphaproteobacteria bacterium]TAF38900.1 MAG: site-specific DNA-methyltransferase [Alphaproteobacteria bacterium]TAF76052.1 MAG: site-specific DNA-methyltransferase [Alphaproteobacteria bacterium]
MAQQTTPAFNQLTEQLKEMFQMDRGDLDFGLYRIMNQKRDEVTTFLEKQLLPQVRAVLNDYQRAGSAGTQAELDKVIANLHDAGVDPETSTKVQDLRAKLGESLDMSRMENEIYSDLYNFFKRYYCEGDFMSMRRYKEGVYALPYEGEEVKLHWANHDQYYIKTTENLKNYSFKTAEGKRVRFEVAAGGTEVANNKAAEGKERRFLLHAAAPTCTTADELTIRFEYRPDDAKRKQDDINKETVAQLFHLAEIHSFGLKAKAPTEKNADRTLLEKHLNDYTAKCSFDYFIHKDLGRFLRRELDFYIKNEIMHLDDIENETAPRVETYLAKVRAMRKVAGKIIQFLAQLEDFQKKLWLKKKFVLETHYCITLDHIIGSEAEDELLPIITANEQQREEWVKLFAIHELEGYSTPLKPAFLKSNDKLLVDTKFFDPAFKYSLLGLFDNLDEQTDGVMINSENFQALNLLQARYKEKIGAIITDPPYNTEDDSFCYKDNYQHSSWISMINDRIAIIKRLLNNEAWVSININDIEIKNLLGILEQNGLSPASTIVAKMSHMSGMKMSHADRKPPKIKEYITISNASESSRITPIYEQCSWDDAFDRYDSFLFKNNSDNPEDWTRTSLREAAIQHGVNVKDDKDAYDDFCIKNAEYIYQRAKNDSLYDLPRDGVFRKVKTATGLDKIALNGKEVLFAANYFKEFEGKKIPAQIKGDIWDDIGINNSHNEGGVSFESGKKPVKLFERLVEMLAKRDDTILDIFAGSGTLAHAVLNCNRKGNKRKFILCEMGEYFDSILKKRVSKVIFSSDWQSGKPIKSGISSSALLKYMALEQYEDTLDNLGDAQGNFGRTEQQELALQHANRYDNQQRFYEGYMLSYMLDVESRGSQSLLNIDAFADPFAYKLRITRNDDTQMVNVDLVETFNYLLGLTIRTVHRDKKGIVTVTGKNASAESCLIIWRNTLEVDNTTLDTWFGTRYPSKDFEFDAIYVNGDNNIENMKLTEDHWKVRLIEAEFKRLMFDVQDV